MGKKGKEVNDAPPMTGMSTKVILARKNLEGYFPDFEKAGYRFIDGAGKLKDIEIEHMLVHAEKGRAAPFPADIRIQLWKALRHTWFLGPGHEVKFVQTESVPRMFLPKRDFKSVDSMLPFGELEADRQRQICRKIRQRRDATMHGPTLETLQFEVYKRETDMFYEYKDVQRCCIEWQKKNPRTMVREDPREEVMKMRIKGLMGVANEQLGVQKKEMKSKICIEWTLLMLRMFFAVASLLMYYTGFYRYRDSPKELVIEFTTGSGQFRAGTSYLIAFWVMHIVVDRAHADPKLSRLRRMLIALERLMEQILEFRVESEELRMVASEARSAEIDFEARDAKHAKKTKKGLSQPKKRKQAKKEVAAVEDEAGEEDENGKQKKKDTLDIAALQKALTESYKRLPDLPAGFEKSKQTGGMRQLRTRDGDQRSGLDAKLMQAVCHRPGNNSAASKFGYDEPLILNNRALPDQKAVTPSSLRNTTPHTDLMISRQDSQGGSSFGGDTPSNKSERSTVHRGQTGERRRVTIESQKKVGFEDEPSMEPLDDRRSDTEGLRSIGAGEDFVPDSSDAPPRSSSSLGPRVAADVDIDRGPAEPPAMAPTPAEDAGPRVAADDVAAAPGAPSVAPPVKASVELPGQLPP